VPENWLIRLVESGAPVWLVVGLLLRPVLMQIVLHLWPDRPEVIRAQALKQLVGMLERLLTDKSGTPPPVITEKVVKALIESASAAGSVADDDESGDEHVPWWRRVWPFNSRGPTA
jgi:hypothetical protein